MQLFSYYRPSTLEEARRLHAEADEADFLSGGQTLLPAMKNRLATPDRLIDLRGIRELKGIRQEGDQLIIGAASTHYEVANSQVVQTCIPILAQLAASIGDPQVRYQGTIGGSLANNDPSADYPAAALGLNASIQTDRRLLAADSFFTGLYTTALTPDEIVLHACFPLPELAGYAKIRSKASRYAVAAALVSRDTSGVRVSITGASTEGVFRWTAAEDVLSRDFTPERLAGLYPDRETMLEDLNADREFRAQLVKVVTQRAVQQPGEAWIR